MQTGILLIQNTLQLSGSPLWPTSLPRPNWDNEFLVTQSASLWERTPVYETFTVVILCREVNNLSSLVVLRDVTGCTKVLGSTDVVLGSQVDTGCSGGALGSQCAQRHTGVTR